MGDTPLDLNRLPTNFDFDFNVSFDGPLEHPGRLWDTHNMPGVVV